MLGLREIGRGERDKSDGSADLLLVGRADVQVAQNRPRTHFVVELVVGASIVSGSGHKAKHGTRVRKE